MIETARGTLTVFADIGCPWAHLAVYRLHAARSRLGLDDRIAFDVRAFPLELFNERPTPKLTLDAEIVAAGALEPRAGWSLWTEPEHTYPVTTLAAMEAVYAAKEQGLGVSDRLDRALRVAFFRDSRCISMHHEIVAIAADVEGLDVKELEANLIEGRHKRDVFEDQELARRSEVKGSPHVFLADGSEAHNPGIAMHWEGGAGGFPVIDSDDPAVYEALIRRSAV